MDGCTELMRVREDMTTEVICFACHCYRKYHKREEEAEVAQPRRRERPMGLDRRRLDKAGPHRNYGLGL